MHALRGISLAIHQGERLALLGKSGSGKSVGHGVESAFLRQLQENDQLRKVYVSSSFEADSADVPAETLHVKGIMTPARRTRLRPAIIARWNREHFARPRALLTDTQMRDLGRIPMCRGSFPRLGKPARR